MTTINLTLHIEEGHGEIVNTFKTLASNLKGVSSFKFEQNIDDSDFTPKNTQEVKTEFRQVLKEIKSGKALEEADDFDNIFIQK